jgi:hypothetical protein
MGELDVEIMTSLFGGPELGKALAPAWNGGVYYAAQRKSATEAEKATPNSLGVFYFSKWKSREAAQSFAKIYSAQLGRKYSGLSERRPDETSGEQVFTTHEGDVLISVSDNGVFISEGFSLVTARKLRDNSIDAQGVGPIRMAVGPELTLGNVRALSAFGAMKAGIAERYTLPSTHSR